MAYIYMDESGDLWFDWKKSKTSKYFVVSFLFIGDEVTRNNTEKIVNKIFRLFQPKERLHHAPVLHAHKETPKTRTKTLGLIASKDVSVLSIYLNKKNVYTRLHDEKHLLYNYIVNILLDRLMKKKIIPLSGKIHFIAAQRETNKFLNENFCAYLENQWKNHKNLDIAVSIRTTHEEKCLQLIDTIAWATYRKYEHDDESYINLINTRIIEENALFP